MAGRSSSRLRHRPCTPAAAKPLPSALRAARPSGCRAHWIPLRYRRFPTWYCPMLTRPEAHRIALSVPGTHEQLYFNKASIFHGDDFVAVVHDKHPAVVLRVSSIEMRDMMLENEPALFYITDHYKKWPGLLV